jgi:serine protease
MVRMSLGLVLALLFAPNAFSKPKQRLIIQYKRSTLNSALKHSPFMRFNSLKARSPFKLQLVKGGFKTDVVEILESGPLRESDLDGLIEDLTNDPQVEFVELDTILKAYKTPGETRGSEDPLYHKQWHYFDPTGGANLTFAWDITVGSDNVVIGVLDTGIRPHKDLEGRIIPGMDMISDTFTGADGDGRDPDATDPGDFITDLDGCGFSSSSSWHGTHVAGTIGANSGNGLGVSGVMWNSKILPIRVLGKCGGYTSDIADGIKWASGLKVKDLTDNPTSAKVLNLSLGGSGACGSYLQQSINEATANGTVIIVAAGNSNKDMDVTSFSPANCDNVITVSATNISGERAFYSNFGTNVDISAPGGNREYGVLSTSNTGSTVPKDDNYVSLIGTSMASPHVAGIVGLLFSVNSKLSFKDVELILSTTAKKFSPSSECGRSKKCGKGMIDAFEAVKLAKSMASGDGPTPSEPTDPDDPGDVEDGQDPIEDGQDPNPPSDDPDDDGSCGKTSDNSSKAFGFFSSLFLGTLLSRFKFLLRYLKK